MYKLVPFILLLFVMLSSALQEPNMIIIDVGNRVFIELVVKTNNPNLISSKLKEVLAPYNIKEVHVEEIEKGIYSIRAKVTEWNKKVFQCNLTSILTELEKPVKIVIKGDKYLKITSTPANGELVYGDSLVIKVDVKVDYGPVILGLCVCYLPPIIAISLILHYIRRRIEKVKDKGYYVVSETLRKLNIIASVIFVCIPLASFIPSLFITDYPGAITFLTGIPLEVVLIVILVSLFLLMFTPIIYSMKYTAPLLGEKEVKRRDYFYAFLFFIPMIGAYILIFMIIAYMPSSVSGFLEKLPVPLRIAPWFLLGLTLATVPFNVADRFLMSRLEKPLEPWIRDYVEGVVKTLGLKRFRRVRKIRTIGGRVANAMVKGILNRELVLTERLVEILDKEEIKAVIAHEIAHHKYRHVELHIILWVVAGILIFSGVGYALEYIGRFRYKMIESWEIISMIAFLSLYIVGFITLILISRFVMRRAEDKADSEALKLISDPRVYIRALAKITIVNLGPMKMGKILEKFETHPSPIKRMLKIARKHGIPEDEVKEMISQALKEITQQ